MIKKITGDEVLDIRNKVLRNSRLSLDECRFPNDDVPGNFHLGAYAGEVLVCIASFHLQNYGDYTGAGWQLRGMATLPAYQGQGWGQKLVQQAIEILEQQAAGYVWCNARKAAVNFYEKLGFAIVSDEFEVPGIGPHYVMYLGLKQSPRA